MVWSSSFPIFITVWWLFPLFCAIFFRELLLFNIKYIMYFRISWFWFILLHINSKSLLEIELTFIIFLISDSVKSSNHLMKSIPKKYRSKRFFRWKSLTLLLNDGLSMLGYPFLIKLSVSNLMIFRRYASIICWNSKESIVAILSCVKLPAITLSAILSNSSLINLVLGNLFL